MITLEHVETNVTLACQNVCVGCNHFVPMQPGIMADPAQIERDLYHLGKIAHVTRWAAIGGEPTLNRRLPDILKIARDSGTVDLVEVWTNGIRLPVMPAEFWAVVDEIDLTLYPGKPVDIEYIQRKCQETGTVLRIKRAEADFTHLLYERHASDTAASAIYRGCWYRTYCRVLDDGYFYRCCTSPFIPPLILELPKGTDGLRVEGASEQELREYLDQAETPASCYRCASNGGPHIGWRETTRADWLSESMR